MRMELDRESDGGPQIDRYILETERQIKTQDRAPNTIVGPRCAVLVPNHQQHWRQDLW